MRGGLTLTCCCPRASSMRRWEENAPADTCHFFLGIFAILTVLNLLWQGGTGEACRVAAAMRSRHSTVCCTAV